ncbi:MAG: TIR domain-containing protein [Anaerolineae bacterium]|nr:TIR domain-containing protein [Chloroflexota bacterium]MBN8635607.1 TIR domain-containing protein [Anaerolineae bacterium]
MADIFISYSRRDAAFAKQLTNALEQSGRDVWIDWQDIPRAADWLNEIFDGIERAETVVNVVSRNSLISEVCNQEIAYARKHGKRIIPLIHENITPDIEAEINAHWGNQLWGSTGIANWEAVRHLNWIFFPKSENGDVAQDVFDREYAALIQAIETDLTHVRLHTRYLVQSLDWDNNAQNPSYLLYGDELTAAEQWLVGWDLDKQRRIDSGEQQLKQPEPTVLQRQFVAASRQAENERAARLMQLETSRKMSEEAAQRSEESAKRAQRDARNARITLITLGVVGTLIIMAVFIFTNLQIGEANAREASAATSVYEAGVEVQSAGERVATAQMRQQEAVIQVANANATLAPIPVTLTRSGVVLDEALTNVANANTVLTAIPPTLTYVSAEIRAGEERIRALRMASYAQQFLEGSEPNAELAALFAIRSLNSLYTETADAVLVPASERLHTLRVFDVAESDDLSAAVIGADGQQAITGSFSGALTVWDTQTGARVRDLAPQPDSINALALTTDGNKLVVALNDQSLLVLDAATGEVLATMPPTFNVISELAISPDGQSVISGARNGVLYLWNINDGSLIRRFTGHTSEIFSLSFSADGEFVVSSANEPTARLWNVATGALVREIETTNVNIVALSPDGRNVLSGSTIDGHIRLWNAKSGSVVQEFTNDTSVAAPIIFSADGRRVLIGTGGSGIRLWDVDSGQMERILEGHSGALLDVAFTPNAETAVSVSIDGTMRVWDLDLTNHSNRVFLGHLGPAIAAAFSPDGQMALSGGSDTMRLWNVATGDLIRPFEGHSGPIFKVAFSADGQMALSASFDGTARLWNVNTGESLRVFNTGEPLFTAAFAPDGQTVITGSQVGTVRQYNLETGALVRELLPHSDSVWALTFSSDGQRLISAANDGEILITDLSADDIFSSFVSFQNHTQVFDIALSPTEPVFAVGAPDYSVQIDSLETGAAQRVLRGHTNVIYALAYSPDGRTLVTASADNTLRLWDVATGETIRVLSGHTGVVRGVDFSPDGRRVISASFDGTVRLWDFDYHDFVAEVCRQLVRDFTPDERLRYSIDPAPTCPR